MKRFCLKKISLGVATSNIDPWATFSIEIIPYEKQGPGVHIFVKMSFIRLMVESTPLIAETMPTADRIKPTATAPKAMIFFLLILFNSLSVYRMGMLTRIGNSSSFSISSGVL
jgi:hypothetical protein